MKKRLKSELKRQGKVAIFDDSGILVSPLPNIKFCHKLSKKNEVLELALVKFSRVSFVDAMYNKKIILVL